MPTSAKFAEGNILKNCANKKVKKLTQTVQEHQNPLLLLNKISPVNVQQLEKWLQGYDEYLATFLFKGFTGGFSIPYQSKRQFRMSKNLKSANENVSILKEKIKHEINLGRIAGPFDECPFKNLQISPLGLVPKKEQGQFRLIHHLSFPEHGSVNDGIPYSLCAVSYQNIDDAVRLLKQCGKGSFMCKTDIEDAFRIVPVSPNDYELLGFCIENKFYYDRCLPMGMSYSCQLFERVSTALQWIADNKLKVSGCAHILDDFFFVAQTYNKALSDLNSFLQCMKDIGVPIKSSKTVFPCITLSFVGIELDSITMEKRLPMEKVDKIRDMLRQTQKRKSVTLKELQSIIGLLSFACSVIVPGRPFLRRLIDLTVGLKKPHHKRRLNKEARADLHTWSLFIDNFNGTSLFLSDTWLQSNLITLVYRCKQFRFWWLLWKILVC